MTDTGRKWVPRGTAMRHAATGLAFGALVWLGGAPRLSAQEPLRLSLEEAQARAAQASAGVRLAEAAARGAHGRATQGLAGFLPQVELRESFLRSTDPVATFGFKLRQERFGAADFDPEMLNHPPPTNEFETVVEIRQPLFQPEAWWGHRAARHGSDAGDAGVERARAEVRHAVVASYFGAELAGARTLLLRQAEATAREHAGRADAMVREGLVTEADAQLAHVRALEVESDRIGAEVDERIALDALRRLLAVPYEMPLVLTDTLAAPEAVSPDVDVWVERALASRADVRAAELQLRAARNAVKSARASLLPSVAAFGQYAWDDPGSPFGSAGDRWTAGVLLTWSPFTGGRRAGRVREAAAGRDAAEARLDDLKRAVAAEVRAAAWRWEAAQSRSSVGRRAVAQAQEALRIVRVRYENELIPVTELLDAETRWTEARLRWLAVRHEAALVRSELSLAVGAEVEPE